MKKLISLLVILMTISASVGQAYAGYVRGYYRKNGTYVQPYYRSNSNSLKSDNYSSWGNYNPYTGKKGTKRW